MTDLEVAGFLGYEALDHYQADAGMPTTRPERVTVAVRADLRLRVFLPSFQGSVGLLVHEEGVVLHPYQPGGAAGTSGVTLDPGIDLSAQDSFILERIHEAVIAEDLFAPEELALLRSCLGLRGAAAAAKLPQVEGITWTTDQAASMLTRLWPTYWSMALSLCDALEQAPPPVQTGAASIVWNCGVGVLSVAIRAAIEGQDWPHLLHLWRLVPKNPPRRAREAGWMASQLGL